RGFPREPGFHRPCTQTYLMPHPCQQEGPENLAALRFLRSAPEERRNIKIIRGCGILLMNDFVDGGTRRFLHDNVLRLDGLFPAPCLPPLWQILRFLVRLPARRLPAF